ncbi:hypothetical protein PybrP1_006031 [[Pythium] brassicae (nom. inval.)]|nr:hypothetical protein PybrP1_006031 [[Pythium] brassicae (nom. inval.)]
MVRRSTIGAFFSPPSARLHAHSAARRRSLPLAPSSGASPSAAQWSRRETALLVQAWRDVAEHPASARESVDAFQTRLFLRFQEVTGDAADDAASVAGSECSMESVEFTDSSNRSGSSALFPPRARTQTSVVMRTYALRRMAAFITSFIAQQQQATAASGAGGGEGEEEASGPVDWFALSKDAQIERFQAAGATSYIELDEHMYGTILTTLELQDKCKQEKTPAGNSSNGTAAAAAPSGDSSSSSRPEWTEQEVRHVVAAWRDAHRRTPTRLPGADSLYARFLALNGETSARSKPEVAALKTALLHMHRVVAAFQSRAPPTGKLTRGTLRRQRQNWFALPLAARQQAFRDGGSRHDCGFVDISEDLYATIGELAAASPSSLALSLELAVNGDDGDAAVDSISRRSSFGLSAIKLEDNTPAALKPRARQRETIDLISDDEGDGGQAAIEETPDQSSAGDDVDMGDDASLADNSVGDGSGTAPTRESEAMLLAAKASARAASEAAEKLFADLKTESTDDALKQQLLDKNESGRSRQNSLKKQKLEHHYRHDLHHRRPHVSSDPSEMAALLEKQARELNALVLQVQEDREREREEREKLLLAMRADQQGRDAVVELLRAEQEERRRDRDERRQMLQLLLREQQELQRKQQQSGGINGSLAGPVDAKLRVKRE